jgi:hypothetical protein
VPSRGNRDAVARDAALKARMISFVPQLMFGATCFASISPFLLFSEMIARGRSTGRMGGSMPRPNWHEYVYERRGRAFLRGAVLAAAGVFDA